MKRWVFGYTAGSIHAAAENVQEFRDRYSTGISRQPTHMIRALCDGEWKPYDHACFWGMDKMPEFDPRVVVCAECVRKWEAES